MANTAAPVSSDKSLTPRKSAFGGNIRQYFMIIALVAITALFAILTGGKLIQPQNVSNLVFQNSYVFILGTGMMLCILTGGNIDLSVGSVVAFIAAIAGTMIIGFHLPVWVGILMAIAGGFAVGAFQGALIAYVRIPPFITTLAGMLMFRGLANVLLQGQTLGPFPTSYTSLTVGFIPDLFPIPGLKLNVFCVAIGVVIALIYIIFALRKRMNKRKYSFEVSPAWMFVIQMVLLAGVIVLLFTWLALDQGLPTVLILVGILIVGYSFFMQKTVPGRYVYAMGGNEKAARLSGINTKKVMFAVYMNMGVLAGVTGLVVSARLNAAAPTAGNMFELDAIGACFIGGASATGGVGTIMGAIIGALVFGVMNMGFDLLGMDAFWRQVIKGAVLLLAVAFDVFAKSRSKTA